MKHQDMKKHSRSRSLEPSRIKENAYMFIIIFKNILLLGHMFVIPRRFVFLRASNSKSAIFYLFPFLLLFLVLSRNSTFFLIPIRVPKIFFSRWWIEFKEPKLYTGCVTKIRANRIISLNKMFLIIKYYIKSFYMAFGGSL